MANWVPAEVFPPGDYIREEMEERGWAQQDLADVLGKTLPGVNELLTGKRSVTSETAQVLEQAFGIDAATWLRLEAMWQASRLPPVQDNGIALRAKLREKVPLREIVRRGWVEPSQDDHEMARRVAAFLDVESIDDEPHWAHAARKSSSYATVSPGEIAWVARSRKLARAVQVAHRFENVKTSQLLADIRKLAVNPADVRRVPQVLAEYGIRLVIVEKLSKTRIDGACFWLNQNAPAIALTVRYDRIDSFWFTLLHELAHLIEGYNDGPSTAESDLVGDRGELPDNQPPEEQKANDFAASVLIDQARLEDFILRVGPLYSTPTISGFAALQNIHPGIVVGQLQFKKEIGWGQHRQFLVKIRDRLLPSALSDGWGFEAPALA